MMVCSLFAFWQRVDHSREKQVRRGGHSLYCKCEWPCTLQSETGTGGKTCPAGLQYLLAGSLLLIFNHHLFDAKGIHSLRDVSPES